MKKRPDIIIINPDEMRWDSMGHAGNRAALTPCLDQFVREEAVSFSHAYLLLKHSVFAHKRFVAFTNGSLYMKKVLSSLPFGLRGAGKLLFPGRGAVHRQDPALPVCGVADPVPGPDAGVHHQHPLFIHQEVPRHSAVLRHGHHPVAGSPGGRLEAPFI